MRQFTVEVHSPIGIIEYTTITAPRVNESICIDGKCVVVKEVAHMLKSWTDGNGKNTLLDYMLVRAE